MATIRASDHVKERLRDLKRNEERFDGLLDRLGRTEKHVEEIAAKPSDIDDGDIEARMQEAHDELNQSLEPLV